MSAYYLIINDDEFNALGQRLTAYWASFETHLSRYVEILAEVRDKGLAAGNRHDMISLYLDTVSELQGVVAETAPKAGLMVKEFLDAIETADTYLYESKYGSHRFYDDQTFGFLMDLLDHPLSVITDSAGDYLLEKIFKLAGGWEKASKTLHESYRLLLDYMNTTKQELISIFDGVHQVDNEYGYNIDNGTGDGFFQISHLGSVSMVMFIVEEMLDALQEMLGSSGTAYTAKDAKQRLNGIWQELNMYRADVRNVPVKSKKPSAAQIHQYSQKKSVKKIISGTQSDIGTFIAREMPGDWEIYFGQMMETFKTKIQSILHGNGLDAKSFQDYVLYMRMLESLEAIETQYGNDGEIRGEDVQKYIDETGLPAVLDLIKKYGNKAADMIEDPSLKDLAKIMSDSALDYEGKIKKVEELLKSHKDLEKTLKGVEGAKLILKYGEKGVTLLARYAASYDRSMEILDSFEASYSINPDMCRRIQAIRDLYEKKASAWLKEAGSVAGDISSDLIMETLEDSIPLFKTVKKALDIGLNVTGIGKRTGNAVLACEYEQILVESKRAYENAVEELEKVDPASKDYEQLATNVYNCFLFHKQNMMAAYDAMAGATTGDKSAYYRYCSLQISKMNMADTQDPYIMSYEDFLALDHKVSPDY